MISADLVQAPGYLNVGERAIRNNADAIVTLLDTTLAIYPTVAFVPTLVLPSAAEMTGTPAGGKRYRFRDANGGAGTHSITVTAPGTTIDGVASLVITVAWGVAEIEWSGSAWQVWTIDEPGFGAVNLASDVTGLLPIANGGTGGNLAGLSVSPKCTHQVH